jgi:hypothetical protein
LVRRDVSEAAEAVENVRRDIPKAAAAVENVNDYSQIGS